MMFRCLSWVVAVAFLFCLGIPSARATVVVATGDSITDGYARIFGRLQFALDELEPGMAQGRVAALSGHSTGMYLNADGVGLSMTHDPDVVAIMLGTNNVIRRVWAPSDLTLANYARDMTAIITAFRDARNSAGVRPKILLLTPPPVIRMPAGVSTTAPNPEDADRFLNDEVIPWILAQEGVTVDRVLDINALIRAQPNWSRFYNDGVHLWGDGESGYRLIAGAVAEESLRLAVPEPATMAVIFAAMTVLTRRAPRAKCRHAAADRLD